MTLFNWTLFNTFSYWTEFGCLYLVGLLKALWLSMNVKCATTNFCYVALVLLFHGGDYLPHFYMPSPLQQEKKKPKKKKHYTLNLGDRWIYVIGNCRVMSMGKSLLNLNGILLQFICTVRCYKKITGVHKPVNSPVCVLGLSLWQIRSFWNPCLPTQ